MKFSYLKIPHSNPNKKWISRPIIPITLYGSKGSVNAILGQERFFDAFRIKFERDCDAIEITPSKKFKNLTKK